MSTDTSVVGRPGTGWEPTPPSAASTSRVDAFLLAGAMALAGYTGFRIPNAWAVTLQTISLQDGFHRRFLIGTVLQPIAGLFGYSYWFYAAVSFTVLALLFTVMGIAYVRTPVVGRRALIIAWLILPTGGFLFNEVGYLDQFLYLALFVALWLRHRSRPIAATVVMTLVPFIDQIRNGSLFRIPKM